MESKIYNSGDLVVFKIKETNEMKEGFFVNTEKVGDVVLLKDKSKIYCIDDVEVLKLVESARHRMVKRIFRLVITFPIFSFIFIILILISICAIISDCYDYWDDKFEKYGKWLGK